jgi:glucokinase
MLEEKKQESVLCANETLSAKDIFDAAREGDALAQAAVDVMSRYLGQIVASTALTVDPDVFVIGGGVSRAGKILTDGITRYYHKYTMLTEQKVPIVLATLGNDAGIYGAARMMLS